MPVIRQPAHTGKPKRSCNATALPTTSWMSAAITAISIMMYTTTFSQNG